MTFSFVLYSPGTMGTRIRVVVSPSAPPPLHQAVALVTGGPGLPTADLVRIERSPASGVVHHSFKGGKLVEQQISKAAARVAGLELVLRSRGLEPFAHEPILRLTSQPINAFDLTRLDREPTLALAAPDLYRPILHVASRSRASGRPPEAQVGFELRVGGVPLFRVQWREAPPGSDHHARGPSVCMIAIFSLPRSRSGRVGERRVRRMDGAAAENKARLQSGVDSKPVRVRNRRLTFGCG